MTDWRDEIEGLTLKGQIKMPYTWSVGEVGSRFLVALRDGNKILGNRCATCGTVYVPPRKNCGRCFVDIGAEEWVELGTEGTVEAYTVVHASPPSFPQERPPAAPPFAYALIRLDGAGVGFLHLVKEGFDRLGPGVRVRARFRPSSERTGSILDIDCFEIVPAEGAPHPGEGAWTESRS